MRYARGNQSLVAGHRSIPSLILGGAWKTAGTTSEGRISRGRFKDRRPSKSRIRSETPRQPASHAVACLAAVLVIALTSAHAYGAVGCTLNDPDRDIKRLFPEATNFKTEFISIKEKGGDKLVSEIEKKLGDKLDKVYETQEVAYAYYTVLKGTEIIGWVHGVNQKGRFGGMQIILASDTKGVILDFYYQKLSSPESRRFRGKEFTEKFKGLKLADFYEFRKLPEDKKAESKVGAIEDPSKKSNQDFRATLRGIMKNLILLDIFKLDRKYDKEGGEHDEEKQ